MTYILYLVNEYKYYPKGLCSKIHLLIIRGNIPFTKAEAIHSVSLGPSLLKNLCFDKAPLQKKGFLINDFY